VQLRAINEQAILQGVLSRDQQGFASELREDRNLWAHNEPSARDDASRALDTIGGLLHAVGASIPQRTTKLRVDLQRTVFEDQTRKQVSVRRCRSNLAPGCVRGER
jgi:hypothetical protein